MNCTSTSLVTFDINSSVHPPFTVGNVETARFVVRYTKPDIIIGTESWLEGIQPGKAPSKSAIKNSEVFPENYQVFRNDRDSKGGGVFLGIHTDITAIEQPDFVSDCENVWAKLNLKSNKDLYVGSFYMSHRNPDDINQLNHSLSMINRNGPKQILLGGDFNCPDINWEINATQENCPDRNVQNALLDMTSDHDLTQIHIEPTL